jgi:hypothetical protein
MKRALIALIICSSVLLFSCQKEAAFSSSAANTGGNSSSAGTQLVKIVGKRGTDSSVEVLTYNSSGKLIGMATTGNDAGTPISSTETYIRNSQGIIQKVILKDIELLQLGIDSLVTNVHYDATLARYTSWVIRYNLLGDDLRDSVAMVYNAGGKVVSQLTYADDGSGIYLHDGKFDYTYSGNNLITKKVFDFDFGVYSEEFTVTDEFDSKVSPIILGNEAFVILQNSIAPLYSANNIVKETITYPMDPTEVYTFTLTYNALNRPVTSIVNFQGGNTGYTQTYYYK